MTYRDFIQQAAQLLVLVVIMLNLAAIVIRNDIIQSYNNKREQIK